MKKEQITKRSDVDLLKMAEKIGEYCDLETVLHFVNAYMASNYLTNMQFELVPPKVGEADPHWDFKYSYRKFDIKGEDDGQKS